jgi:sulfatase-like protein
VAAALASLVAALLLLDVSVSFDNIWPTPAVKWTGAVSAELAVCIAAMAIAARRGRQPSRAIVSFLSALWIALALGRYADVTAPALYGRDVNLYWDLRFIPDVVAMVTRVAHAWLIVVAIVVVAIVFTVTYVLLRSAWRRVGRAMQQVRERRVLEGASVILIALFALQQVSEHAPPIPQFSAPVTAGYARQARFAITALTASTFVPPSPPMDADLSHIAGADVFVIFIEAYGAVTYTGPQIARALEPARAQLSAAIRDTHRTVISAFVESPTFGGSSWLAHISLLSGIEVRDADRNARLMTERRDTLARAFGRRGFRTIALMPGLRLGWPEGAFYGFDEIYGADRLAYRGPEFGWFAIPDQYALQRLDAIEVNTPSRPPLFVFFPTISTHFPFSPVPPYQPDWTRMTDRRPYDGPSIVRAYGRELDWVNFGPAYAEAIAYDFATIGGYLRLRADRDFVLVILGDHQPAAAVSGEHASWDVPVHVIASRSDVIDRLRAHGFTSGLTPASTRLGKMNALTPLLLDAFSCRGGLQACGAAPTTTSY